MLNGFNHFMYETLWIMSYVYYLCIYGVFMQYLFFFLGTGRICRKVLFIYIIMFMKMKNEHDTLFGFYVIFMCVNIGAFFAYVMYVNGRDHFW